jgi:hypothetical protein
MGNNTSKNMWPSFKHTNNYDEERFESNVYRNSKEQDFVLNI